jgi:cold shock protein
MDRRCPDLGKPPHKVIREAALLPQEPIGTESATTGTVKWWSDDKGLGAIASEKTAPWDIWCHFSFVEGEGFRRLIPGEAVELVYVRADQESFRYVARRVRRLSAASNDANGEAG